MNTRSVRVTLQGAEVAKWWRRMLGDKHGMDWDRSKPFFPIGGSFPIYRDIPTEQGTSAWSGEPYSDVPYMGEDTYVELRINPGAIAHMGELDTGQLAITAICLLQQEGVPVGQCSKLRVEIEGDR